MIELQKIGPARRSHRDNVFRFEFFVISAVYTGLHFFSGIICKKGGDDGPGDILIRSADHLGRLKRQSRNGIRNVKSSVFRQSLDDSLSRSLLSGTSAGAFVLDHEKSPLDIV